MGMVFSCTHDSGVLQGFECTPINANNALTKQAFPKHAIALHWFQAKHDQHKVQTKTSWLVYYLNNEMFSGNTLIGEW